MLLRPLPYPDPDRLVQLSERHAGTIGPLEGPLLSNSTYDGWRNATTLDGGIAAYSADTVTLRIANETTRLGGASVSPSLFRLLRVNPVLGRFFAGSEATADQHPVVIGHALWQGRFGGRAEVLGTTLVIDGTAHTVIGVAPAGFGFPSAAAQLWKPYVLRPSTNTPDGPMNVFFAIARLRDGATPEQASAEGTAAARSMTRSLHAELLFGKGGPVEVSARPIVDEMTSKVRPALLVLIAGVALVLLIACANVANLLLSRGVDRQRELALRVALGASGGQISRLLLVESVGLSVLGGAAGLLLGWLLVRLVPVLAPSDFPRLDAVELDARSVAFAALASLTAGLVAGLMPALHGARTALATAIHDDDRRTATGGRTGRRILLAAEAALAVVLLVAAALLGRSFVNLLGTSSGFDPNNVLTARIHPDPTGPPASRHHLVEDVVNRIRALPQVVDAAAGNMAPFANSTYIAGFMVPPRGPNAEPVLARALEYVVTPGYVRATGMAIREGRSLTAEDTTSPTRAVLVNETFARSYFARSAVGQRWANSKGEISEIVGIVGDVRRNGPLSDIEPEMYVVERESNTLGREIYVVIRTQGDPLSVAPALRSLVTELAPTAALDHVETLSGRVSASISEPRFVMTILVTFAGVALALAAIGLYGALSYSVAQRRRELGVRAALGASQRHLVGLVLAQGLGTTIVGLGLGVGAAAGLSRLMSRLLFGVAPLDGASFVLAPLVLLVVALAACVAPARRAATADPAEALGGE